MSNSETDFVLNKLFVKFILLLIFVLLLNPAFTQLNDWALRDDYYINLKDMELDNQGNLIMLGSVDLYHRSVDLDPSSGEFIVSADSTSYKSFLRKINTYGELEWVMFVDHSLEDIELDDFNNIYLSKSNYLRKLNKDGDFIWSKQLTNGSNSVINKFEIINNGDILITGGFSGNVDFNNGPDENLLECSSTTWNCIYVLLLDSLADFKWVKKIEVQGFESMVNVNSIVRDKYGNIYVAGTYSGTLVLDTIDLNGILQANFLTENYIAKYDSLGNFLWVKENGISEFDLFTKIYGTDLFGNVYLGGIFKNTTDFYPGDNISNYVSQGGSDIFIQKLDSMGNLLWLKQFGGAYTDLIADMFIDSIGNIYHYGSFDGVADMNPESSVLSLTALGNGYYKELLSYGDYEWYEIAPATDTYIQKINNSGIIEWTGQIGGKYDDLAKWIFVNENEYIIFNGYYRNGTDFRPGIDSLFADDSNSLDLVTVKLSQPIDGLTPLFESEAPLIYPNPASDILLIQTGLLYDKFQIKIFNINGEEVLQKNYIIENTSIDISNLSIGIYVLYLFNETENYAFKFVITR